MEYGRTVAALSSAAQCIDADVHTLDGMSSPHGTMNECMERLLPSLGGCGGLPGGYEKCFKDCMNTDKGLGLTDTCVHCLYVPLTDNFKNCKAACLLGWCKSGCLECTQATRDTISTDCVGHSLPEPEPCLVIEV